MTDKIATIQVGDEFWSTLEKFSNQKELLKRKLKEFLSKKAADPTTPISKSDYRFIGNLAQSGLSHIHLTFDISLVYDIRGNTLKLYGLYSHDDIGTGSPPNRNKQRQALDRWAATNFTTPTSDSLVAGLASSERATAEPSKKAPSTARPVAKPATQQQTYADRVLSAAEHVDAQWPERRFYEKFMRAQTNDKRMELVRSEAVYLVSLREKYKTLHKNQIAFMNALKPLVDLLSKQ
jgi:mRNA-degrading endonuclease YafQ of YafQ-DinJ toxin-antitoxin module